MTVKITDVSRSNGRVTSVEARIGDITIRYVLFEGAPTESLRMRDVQVLDTDTLRIPPADFRTLQRQVRQIFREGRPTVKTGPVQGQLIPSSTDLS